MWDNCTKQEANGLEKIQNEAARIVREQPNLHEFNLYCLAQGGSLTSRREKHKLVLFYKMINSLAPHHLYHQLLVIQVNILACVTRRTIRQSLQDPNNTTTTHFSLQPRAFGTVFQTILRTLNLLNPLNINSSITLPNHHLITSLVHDSDKYTMPPYD